MTEHSAVDLIVTSSEQRANILSRALFGLFIGSGFGEHEPRPRCGKQDYSRSAVSRLQARNIHGVDVTVSGSGPWTHLQFRRFAGCPICNLQLQSIIARHQDITEAGIREVVVFHSPYAELLPYQGRFPFDVIGDPTKGLYRKYGVESSISAFRLLKA